MTKEACLSQAYENTSHAMTILGRMWKRRQGTIADTAELVNALRKAACAAQELENQLHGNPPPKIG